MIPLIVLIVTFAISFAITRSWLKAGRIAFAAMFLLTASAHFVPGQRESLIGMVPPQFPNPALLVTITGVLELLGAVGLLIPRTSRFAAASLALLVAAMFPANVYAALHGLTVVGRPATPLIPRTMMQLAFIVGLILIAWQPRFARRTTASA